VRSVEFEGTGTGALFQILIPSVVIPTHDFYLGMCTHTCYAVGQVAANTGFVLQTPALTTLGHSFLASANPVNVHMTMPTIFFSGQLNPVNDSGQWTLTREHTSYQADGNNRGRLRFLFFRGVSTF
jgi:hypothetical protein